MQILEPDIHRRVQDSGSERSERILLFAPENAREATWAYDVLREAKLVCDRFTDIDTLYRALAGGAGSILVAAEAITERAVRLLSKLQARRPPWSNLPIVVLTDGDPSSIQRLHDLDLFGPDTSSNITILERPVHEVTLVTVMQAALRARRRQYEVRTLLSDLEAKNEALRASEDALRVANEHLEERVAERTTQVRELALALTTAEQRERNRISQILHDHLQQLIHGAKMWTEMLRDEGENAPPEALPRAIDLLEDALSTTRSLTVELSPPVLRSDGLAAALHWLVDHMAETQGLQVDLDVDDDLCIAEEDLRTLLFEMVHELLFNVVKHADVDRASVRARTEQDRCVIDVVDEGVGFDVETLEERADPDGGFGLFSVRERLDLIGGSLEIDTAPGRGTRVMLSAPNEPKS